MWGHTHWDHIVTHLKGSVCPQRSFLLTMKPRVLSSDLSAKREPVSQMRTCQPVKSDLLNMGPWGSLGQRGRGAKWGDRGPGSFLLLTTNSVSDFAKSTLTSLVSLLTIKNSSCSLGPQCYFSIWWTSLAPEHSTSNIFHVEHWLVSISCSIAPSNTVFCSAKNSLSN